MYLFRRLAVVFVLLSTTIFLIWFLPRVLDPTPPSSADRLRDKQWVNSSPYWVDRQICRWFSLCGVHHVRSDPASHDQQPGEDEGGEHDLRRVDLRKRSRSTPITGSGPSSKRTKEEIWGPRRQRRDMSRSKQESYRAGEAGEAGDAGGPEDVPDYVLRYAPLVHLHSEEFFFPSDISDHIDHMIPFADGEALNLTDALNLDELHDLDSRPSLVYLTSDKDVEDRPDWLYSHTGMPRPFDSEGDDRPPLPPGVGGEDQQDGGPGRPRQGSTWWDVDKDHPIERISRPLTGPAKRRGGRKSRISRRSTLGPRKQVPLVQEAPKDTPDTPDAPDAPDSQGFSDAPAVLVLVDKGSGILDAFWFFFYSYNLGQTVLKIRFGNHVGDWEHCMVRFENGVPRALFMSEHAGGQAYAWGALEKRATLTNVSGVVETVERPVIYSAIGSHAMYAFPGDHPYVLPFSMLKDETDRGPLWDPAKNTYSYTYDYVADKKYGQDKREANRTSLQPTAENPEAPTSWFHFGGPWGDETYALSDARQWRLFGQYHYITGPQGPKFKSLDRRNVCQTEKCTILHTIEAGKKAAWYG